MDKDKTIFFLSLDMHRERKGWTKAQLEKNYKDTICMMCSDPGENIPKWEDLPEHYRKLHEEVWSEYLNKK